MLWQIDKLNNLWGIDWLNLVLLSSGRRLTREASVDNPTCMNGMPMPFFKPIYPICIAKKPLKQAYVRFVDEKENLMGIDWFNPDLLSSGRRLTR